MRTIPNTVAAIVALTTALTVSACGSGGNSSSAGSAPAKVDGPVDITTSTSVSPHTFGTACTDYAGWDGTGGFRGAGAYPPNFKSCIRVNGRDYPVLEVRGDERKYDPDMVVVEYRIESVNAKSISLEYSTDAGTVTEALAMPPNGDRIDDQPTPRGGLIGAQDGFVGWMSAKYNMADIPIPRIKISTTGAGSSANCYIKIQGRATDPVEERASAGDVTCKVLPETTK